MATVAQKTANQRGGVSTRTMTRAFKTLTMAAGVTVSDSITVPAGSHLNSVKAETGAAFTGTPTNINLRVGSAATGQQVVADVDVKAQGHVAATVVSSFDAIASTITYYLQLAANGGTSPAGSVTVCIDYFPPN